MNRSIDLNYGEDISQKPIAIIDYGMGNISSVKNMIKKLGGKSVLTRDPDIILNSKKIILPGVGSFDSGIESLKKNGLEDVLKESASKGANILGICLGFQLLFENSEEGVLPGLGLIKGKVKKFINTDNLRVPHMGWNSIIPTKNSILFNEQNTETPRFYFVHSFYADCSIDEDITAKCFYGHKFVCAIEKRNILGVQFHPEKSHKFGINLFSRYLDA
tara:strand:- start:12517 stop:13170 length:654 start_codon:yes stop_codon:yes gene_type:complete